MISDRRQRIVEELKKLVETVHDQAVRQQLEDAISYLVDQGRDTTAMRDATASTEINIGQNVQQIITRHEFPEDLLAPIRKLIDELKPEIFLSYARGDDEPFVEQLYNDLTGRGFTVWWDRKNMPSRGNAFPKEIGDAIAATDRLLAVCGPAYRSSVICRAEMDHAHATCTIITPVLRLGDYNILPSDIAILHAVDMRESRSYEEALEELLDKLGDRTNPPAMLLGVPALPAHYLPRTDDLDAIAQLVMADATSPTIITSEKQTAALQGMGGIGKSVIAMAFCHHCVTRRFFSDGIIWLQVGLKPNVLLLLNSVARTLNSFHAYRIESDARVGLQRLLADKCCLIVLDDVWDAKYADPFRDIVDGTRCRLLVTTRNTQVIESIHNKR